MTSNTAPATLTIDRAFFARQAMRMALGHWTPLDGRKPFSKRNADQRLRQFPVTGAVTANSLGAIPFGALLLPPVKHAGGYLPTGYGWADFAAYNYTVSRAKVSGYDGRIVLDCDAWIGTKRVGSACFILPADSVVQFLDCLPALTRPIRPWVDDQYRPAGNVAAINCLIVDALNGRGAFPEVLPHAEPLGRTLERVAALDPILL